MKILINDYLSYQSYMDYEYMQKSGHTDQRILVRRVGLSWLPNFVKLLEFIITRSIDQFQ